MKINEREIYNLYSKESVRRGLSKNCTMPDNGVKELEIAVLTKYLSRIIPLIKTTVSILEIGCGNGFTISKFAKLFKKSQFTAIDINEGMISKANQRKLPNVAFKKMSALSLDFEDKKFDVVYTERCLMNLVSWENQKKALKEIHRVLKDNGTLISIETFLSGWKKLNKSRKTLGIPEIEIPPQSTPYIDKEFKKFTKDMFKNYTLYENDENFLSSYYYGARILYPSLIGKNNLVYNNPFIEIFKYLPPLSNYSPIQLRILVKK